MNRSVEFDPQTFDLVETYRRECTDGIPSFSEAVRFLINKGVEKIVDESSSPDSKP